MDFLAGKRTYILGGIMMLQGIVAAILPDNSLVTELKMTPELFMQGVAFIALRKGVKSMGK